MDKAIEKIGRALQRKFNWNIAIYLRHPERDEYFNEMASEALYQAEKLGYRKLPKDKIIEWVKALLVEYEQRSQNLGLEAVSELIDELSTKYSQTIQ